MFCFHLNALFAVFKKSLLRFFVVLEVAGLFHQTLDGSKSKSVHVQSSFLDAVFLGNSLVTDSQSILKSTVRGTLHWTAPRDVMRNLKQKSNEAKQQIFKSSKKLKVLTKGEISINDSDANMAMQDGIASYHMLQRKLVKNFKQCLQIRNCESQVVIIKIHSKSKWMKVTVLFFAQQQKNWRNVLEKCGGKYFSFNKKNRIF